jgi:hypothetical protein
MSTGGLSKARLGRMHNVMAGHVERGEVPGIVTLVSRRGEVHVDAIGMKAVGGRDPMRRDTIFRITSMTKPITAAATMILVEECKLRLDEPVDRLLPELAGRRVLKSLDGPLDDTVPAKRPITVRDLLTLRMGFGVVMGPPDVYPIQKAVGELQIVGFGPPNQSTPHDPDEWIRRLGTLPLMVRPRLLGQPRLGVRRVHGHPARRRGGGSGTVRLGRRLWHVLVVGSQGGHGRDPDDPARGLPTVLWYLSRFLDLGLPGDRRLNASISPSSGGHP